MASDLDTSLALLLDHRKGISTRRWRSYSITEEGRRSYSITEEGRRSYSITEEGRRSYSITELRLSDDQAGRPPR